MKSRLLLFLFAGIFSGFVSCKKDDDSEQKALEKRIFDAYIENNDITVSPTASGLYYLEEVAGTGIHPDSGDWVLIDYDLYLIDGENLIFSSNKDKAVEYSLYDERILYGGSKFHLGTNLQGFDEGLLMMKE